jgi:hypothetical protein
METIAVMKTIAVLMMVAEMTEIHRRRYKACFKSTKW